MSDLLISTLEGDGINLSFFQFLWNKNDGLHETLKDRKSTTVKPQREKPKPSKDSNLECDELCDERIHLDKTDPTACELRIPDTVIFQYGQPFNWYFTSHKSSDPCKRKRRRIPSILRKRRQNVNMESIEREFIKRCQSDHGGNLDIKRDIVAYFIASKDCTSRRRHHSLSDQNRYQDLNLSTALQNTSCNTVDSKKGDDDVDDDALCDIEYLNSEGLHEFLFNKRSKQSGILQRFLEPAGEGTHNSQIRVIWTPTLCLVERRKCKQSLNDMRYGLYERAVTFDGPDVYSTSIPVRGTILAGELKRICDSLVEQFATFSRSSIPLYPLIHNPSSIDKDDLSILAGGKKVARMVVHFKLDSRNRIWLLYSSSIRLIDRGPNVPNIHMGRGGYCREDMHDHTDTSSSSPMNITNIVKLPPTIQLHQNANHNRSVVTMSQELSLVSCISCARKESLCNFQNITYKTVVSQYEHAMVMLKSSSDYVAEWQWPPRKEFIKAAGDVGFGPLWINSPQTIHPRPLENNKVHAYSRPSGIRLESTARKLISEEDLVIPPMIRHLHPRLRVDGYRRYRADPHFLQKTCPVCEHCFLCYANLVTSSFQMTRPVIVS